MEDLEKSNVSAVANIMNALKSKDEEKIKEAYDQWQKEILDRVVKKFEDIDDSTDRSILASRGIRQLTKKERTFYNKWIEAAKSDHPKDAVADLLPSVEVTIIEDVFNELKQEHPLLKKIKFKYVKYLTKVLVHGENAKNYLWGKVTSQITSQIEADISEIDFSQNKLSCYAILALDMLDLGPEFLDTYYREVLKDAIAEGSEYGIVLGNGKDMPVGLNRDIHKGVSFNSETGYPEKEAIKVKSFTPKNYGELVAKISKTEKGNSRVIKDLTMICNPTDYLTKIMPATTTMVDGRYINDIFPIPTEVIQVNCMTEGKAILFLPHLYYAGIGHSKNGNIDYSDDFKFLEDARTYKTKLFMGGIAKDNNVALLLDISELEEFYTVVKAEVTGKVQTEEASI